MLPKHSGVSLVESLEFDDGRRKNKKRLISTSSATQGRSLQTSFFFLALASPAVGILASLLFSFLPPCLRGSRSAAVCCKLELVYDAP